MTTLIEFLMPYFPWVFYPTLVVGFFWGLSRVFKPALSRMYKTRTDAMKAANGPIGQGGQLDKYDSFLELATSMESGLVFEMNSVGDQLKKDGKEPMQDAGYQKMINDLHKIQNYKHKLMNNPIYMLGDTIGFPILKGLIPDAERAGKKWLRALGNSGLIA